MGVSSSSPGLNSNKYCAPTQRTLVELTAWLNERMSDLADVHNLDFISSAYMSSINFSSCASCSLVWCKQKRLQLTYDSTRFMKIFTWQWNSRLFKSLINLWHGKQINKESPFEMESHKDWSKAELNCKRNKSMSEPLGKFRKTITRGFRTYFFIIRNWWKLEIRLKKLSDGTRKWELRFRKFLSFCWI